MKKISVITVALFILPLTLQAKPVNGRVTAGSAEISSSLMQTSVRQHSDRAIVDWDVFSIEKGYAVEILQPSSSSASLHRVVSSIPSEIYGKLSSNGTVFLLNPNGILIGPEGRIETSGFVASTLSLEDQQFLSNQDLHFSGSSGTILNLGVIECVRGDVYLFAPTIRNEGKIAVTEGVLGQGAGTEVFLQLQGEERVLIRGKGKIVNCGIQEALSLEIKANGGNPYAVAIQDDGLVNATGFEVNEGRIFLRADSGKVALNGSMVASQGKIEATADEIHVFAGAELSVDAKDRGDGGSIFLLGNELVSVEGLVTARSGKLEGDGGFIEFSAPSVQYLSAVDASSSCGRAGSFLLDPYNVIISSVDPGLPDSWVNSAVLGATLTGGTSVTISTAVTTNYTRSGSNALAGDLTVNSTVTATGLGNGSLTLIADNDITVNASISINSGNLNLQPNNNLTINAPISAVSFAPITASGIISIVSPATVTSTGSGNSLSLSGNNGVFVNNAQSTTSLCQVQTNNAELDFISGMGEIRIFGSNSLPTVLSTGTGSLFLTSNGDISVVGWVSTGEVKAQSFGGNIYVGNDSTGTLSMGISTHFFDPSGATDASFNANAITFQAGTGLVEGVLFQKKNFSAIAGTGDLSFLGGNAKDGFVSITEVGSFPGTKSLTALMGSAIFQDGSGMGSAVGFDGNLVNVNVALDLQWLGSASPSNGGVFFTSATGGTFNIGQDLIVLPGSGSSQVFSQIPGPSTLAIGRDFTLGGPAVAAAWEIDFFDVVFAIGNDLSIVGGNQNGRLRLIQSGSLLQSIGHDFTMTGGTSGSLQFIVASDAAASLAIGNDFSSTGGAAAMSLEPVGEFILSSVSVANAFSLSGATSGTLLKFLPANNQSNLLIHGDATITGGTGGGAYLESGDFFQMEVLGDLTLQGGSGSTPDAQIISSLSVDNSFQHIYVNGDLTLDPGTGTDEGVAIICALTSAGASIATEQRIDVGQNILMTGGASNVRVGILGFVQDDPMGIVGDASDSLGPTCIVRSLGLITATNGSGIYPVSLENSDVLAPVLGFPVPPPANVAYTPGDIIIQAGGDVTLSSGIATGSTVGLYNANNALFIQANEQFANGALWPDNFILGVSGPSLYPAGQGAVIANTSPLNINVPLTTVNGNISLLSAQNDTASNPIDCVIGTGINQFLLSTTAGNFLVYGFNDIQTTSFLSTTGNATVVSPATNQIHLESHASILTTAPITVSGSGFSIGILSSIAPSITGNIDLQESISADSSTGTININSRVGYVHQTIGTLTAGTINLTAAAGITNTLQADMAVRTAANAITAVTTSSILYLNNTALGPNTANTVVSLSNGIGTSNLGRDLYFAQYGGRSLFVNQAIADGNVSLLALAGEENITLNGPVRAGANLIGVAFHNLNLTGSGFVRAEENVTLILDEAAGGANGSSTFVNASTSGGILSYAGNVAIYASSGPQAPAGTSVPNLSLLGSYSSAATWDQNKPGGLLSKYDTSWDDGGPFHGPGFGTVYTPGTGVFGSNVIWYKAIPGVVPPTPTVGFVQEIDQIFSLLNDFKKWGEEIAFSVRWVGTKNDYPLLKESSYFLVDDPKQTHKVDNSYDRLKRRKFVYEY
ncbi:MAG: filamentous hemagglutinin N-terminal domain-containing protein [Rhabdochlamydiaceae bacterium]|nr:filamentous hemagglutinin N-terminal domain-containing protein [Rhabdochlamydiaceae bacterium]